MHEERWQEMLMEHSKAGIRNYSIFQNGTQFYYCFECDDVDQAFSYIAKNEAYNKWNALTSNMVEGYFDFNEKEPIKLFTRSVLFKVIKFSLKRKIKTVKKQN